MKWFFLFVIAACFVGMFMSVRQFDRFQADCEHRGGVTVRLKSGLACMDPKAFR
jgi:hypothetical protein